MVASKGGADEGCKTNDSANTQGLEPDVEIGLVAGAFGSFTDDNLAIFPDGVDAVTAALPELVPGDTDQEAAGDLQGAEDSVGVGHQGGVVGQHS